MITVKSGQNKISNTSALNRAIDIYQAAKSEPTERCVINGLSCSERFRVDLNNAKYSGKSSGDAFKLAIFNTLSTCSQLNGYEGSHAQFNAGIRLIINTAGHLLGMAFAQEEGGCPGNDGNTSSWKDPNDIQERSSKSD